MRICYVTHHYSALMSPAGSVLKLERLHFRSNPLQMITGMYPRF